MSILTPPNPREDVHYPESDGKPIADNTRQFRYIVTFQGGLDYLFRNDPDVFVAGDLLWYPVEGNPSVNTAPDVMVVFGRPKGDRGAYVQHREAGIGPQVIFEVLSPNSGIPEMIRKFLFYQQYGVDEYYLYDPDRGIVVGWQRAGEELEEIVAMQGWVSPRLGVRFVLEGIDLKLIQPDGTPFASYLELAQRTLEAQAQIEQAQAQAEQAQAQAEQERKRAERLAELLRELGIDPEE